jgi:hypothetical protein
VLDDFDADDRDLLVFEAEGSRFRVRDPLERHDLAARTDRPVDPTPVAVDAVPAPVGSAVRIDPGRLAFDTQIGVYVRDDDGQMLADASQNGEYPVTDPERVLLEVNAAVKTYLVADPPVTVRQSFEETAVDLAGPVVVGCRSRHTRPAADVVVPPTPEGVMRALSLTGSALKTTGAERAWPSLRGHPPRIRLDEDLDQPVVPDGLAVPDTGLTLYTPPEFDAVYPLAPLAFYLGADLRPGAPRLVTDAGHEYPLDHDGSVEATAERLLRQCLLFDCAVRMDGLYSFPLRERQAVEGLLEAPFADVYDWPTHEQVEAYLRVDPAAVRPHLPRWEVLAHVAPDSASAPLLPYLLDDLAVVRTARDEKRAGKANHDGRANDDPAEDGLADDDHTRSRGRVEHATGGHDRHAASGAFDGADPGPIERVWVGPGVPSGATKATVAGHEHGLEATPRAERPVVDVVRGTDQGSAEAATVTESYADASPVTVRVHESVGVDRLRSLLAESNFLHFVGHADREGLHCHDGTLDLATVSETTVEGFVLNACRSYRQGEALVEAGAVGGLVTLGPVAESGAVEMGETVVRALGVGCRLRTALWVAREVSPFAGDYLVVGDGGYGLTSPGDGKEEILRLRATDDGQVGARPRAMGAEVGGMGGVYTAWLHDGQPHTLTPSGSPEALFTPEEFLEETAPGGNLIVADGDLHLTNEAAVAALGLEHGSG